MSSRWYYTADGKTTLGPCSLEQMHALVRSGQLNPSSMTCQEGTVTWVRAATFPELFPPHPPAAPSQRPAPVAVPVRTQPSPEPTRAGPETLFDFDREPSPNQEPGSRERSVGSGEPFWPLVGTVIARGVRAVLAVPVDTWKEARRRIGLFGLRRLLQRQRQELEQFFVEAGSGLLARAVRVPECEEIGLKLRQVSQAHGAAVMQTMRGNTDKRREATLLEKELRSLSADYVGKVLASGVAFDGRAKELARKQQIETALALTQAEIDSRGRQWTAAPPRTKWHVAIGLAVLVLFVPGLVWLSMPAHSRPRERVKEPIAVKKEPAPTETPAQAKKPETMQDWFVQLSPAVPLVEAAESGSGSGFLIEQGGKYLVVTNRHVIEEARKGVAIHFPISDDARFTIPTYKTKVVAIHRSTDLALVDVSTSAADIKRMGIMPVQLAPSGKRPRVGDKVFAIGHPGGRGKMVLTSTLSDGIISAVGRPLEGARFLQVTAPINPGNSGGPLFDSEGRVVGVNTFTIRKRAGDEMTLEALNFALQVEYVHEIATTPSKSLDAREIAAVLNPPPAEATAGMRLAMEEKHKRLGEGGYKPMLRPESKTPLVVFRLSPGEQRGIAFSGAKGGRYAVAVVSEGVEDLDLAVLNPERTGPLVQDNTTRPDPEVKCRLDKDGVYFIFVRNSMETPALVAVSLMKK